VREQTTVQVVFTGHVDHGKSTIIGRILADTGSLPEGKLEQVKEMCRRNSKPFEYAFLLDALKDEQKQGITIDTARCFFKTKKRNYIIIDAPGHIEFLKNMVTGAARAQAAFLVIDANEGVKENSRRHGYLLSMLGVKQAAVIINKMDLVNFSEKVFNDVKKEYKEFLEKIELSVTDFIPASGTTGENIAKKSGIMDWYNGESVLETLDSLKIPEINDDRPFRMPVQGIYKFTSNGDSRRIVAGTVVSGTLKKGDEVVFFPSGKKTIVETIEAFNEGESNYIPTGKAGGFTLKEQIYVKRGEIASLAKEQKLQALQKTDPVLYLFLGLVNLVIFLFFSWVF